MRAVIDVSVMEGALRSAGAPPERRAQVWIDAPFESTATVTGMSSDHEFADRLHAEILEGKDARGSDAIETR